MIIQKNKMLLKAYDLLFYIQQKRLTFLLGVTQYCPMFLPYSYRAKKIDKYLYIYNLFRRNPSEIVHSNHCLLKCKNKIWNIYY